MTNFFFRAGLLIIFFVFQSNIGFSQGGKTLHLSMKEAILLSLRYNPNVESAQLQRVVDKFNLAVAKNQFEFQYALGGSATSTQSTSGGSPLSTTRAFNLSPGLAKQTHYGTQYTLNMSNPVNYSSSFPQYLYAPSLTLSVTHPILQGSGRVITDAGLNQAFINDDSAKLNLKQTIMAQVTQIIQDYLAVVSAENALIVDTAALKSATEVVKQNKVQIAIGFMAPAENIQAEANIAAQKIQLESDMNVLQLAKLNLLKDIGLSPSTDISVNKEILVNNLNYPKGEAAKKLLFSHNISYLQALNGLKSSKLSLLLAEDQQRWTLNMAGSLVQGGGSGLGPNGGLDSLFNGLNQSKSLGLTLTVPIDNMSKQSQLVGAKVSYSQLKLSVKQLQLSLEIQLIGALENLSIVFKQIGLAEQAQALAQQSYLNAVKRASVGQASMFEVTTLQNTYTSNQLQTIASKINYLLSVTNYQQELGITLDVWNISITY